MIETARILQAPGEETSVRVSLARSSVSFSVASGQPMLGAALRAGLKLPHGCRSGHCGACRVRLLSGAVDYPNGRPLGLSATDMGAGFILLCQARPLDDLSIETVEVAVSGSVRVKRLPGRIERTEPWSHDVLGMFLRLPAAESFDFAPGQYLDVMPGAGRRQSLSIASPPHDAGLLELHVSRDPGGNWPQPVFADPSDRSLVTVEGPLGSFVYHDDRRRAPILLIAGATGLAPLMSILRHVGENDPGRKILLYWGVRAAEDLYADRRLEELAARIPGFQYRAVLSAAAAGWRGRRGRVHAAAAGELGSLAGYDIYASGPAAMIEAIRRDFPRHEADPERLFLDPGS